MRHPGADLAYRGVMALSNDLGIPFPLSPSTGSEWSVDGEAGSLTVTAAAHSDLFIEPGDTTQTIMNAVTLLGDPPPGDFQLSARVTVRFASTFDAGVLMLWIDERRWAKLCFEYSPDGEPMVVSVVTRGASDDSNGFMVGGDTVWLRVSRIGGAVAFHASTDGRRWRMIRSFTIDGVAGSIRVGFEAQAPTGEGCDVRFDEILFRQERLQDLRDGS